MHGSRPEKQVRLADLARRARALGRLVVSCLLAAAVVSVATPPAGAFPVAARYQYGRRHHRHRHHHRRRHHRHHRRHSRRAKASAAQDSHGWSATARCPNAHTAAASATAAQMIAAVDCLINQQRLRFGLPVMAVNGKLNTSAQNWTDSMIASGNFTHGTNFGGRLSAVAYDWQEGGENIATGYMTPASVVEAWMASPDHCSNILDPDFRDMGTGETPAAVGNWASGPATWTQDFGLTFSQNPLSHNNHPMYGCPYTVTVR